MAADRKLVIGDVALDDGLISVWGGEHWHVVRDPVDILALAISRLAEAVLADAPADQEYLVHQVLDLLAHRNQRR